MKTIKQLSIWIIAFWMAMTAGASMAQGANMSRYIKLTVQPNESIKLRLRAEAKNTPVRVVGGTNTTDITVGTVWSGKQNFTSSETEIIVYGDIIGFDCWGNGVKLTGVDVSNNTELEFLDCHWNHISALDISANTQLEDLYCSSNHLTALDISTNTKLRNLSCDGNQLTSLDISANTELWKLDCYNNQLTALNTGANTQLTHLNCSRNQLTALNVSGCAQLDELYCNKNNFSVAALNLLYCSLPDRSAAAYKGEIYPAYDNTDPLHANVLASSGSIVTGKNWKVVYEADGSDIPTTGTETCGSPMLDVLPTSLTFAVAGETKSFTVSANVNWTASSDASWLTLSPDNGTGDATVNVTAEASSSVTRTATITIEQDGGALTKTVTVTQGLNMSHYIKLTIQPNESISLIFSAEADNTPVRVVGGTNTTDITVGTVWSSEQSFTSTETEITVYGDITAFDCGDNGAKLTGVDASHNTELRVLYCSSNHLTALDISANTKLGRLSCSGNQLTVLDISANTQLGGLNCSGNLLTALDVSANTNLRSLDCYNNQLTELDVSANTRLWELRCY